MKRKLFIVLMIVVFAMAAVVSGCGGGGNESSSGGEGNQAAEVKSQKWRYQSIWPASIALWRGDKYFGQLVDVLAGDELEIEYYDGDELVKTKEVFDAVSTGTLDMATDWPSYWDGKNTAFSLITSVPMGFTPADYMIWYWQGGGLELAQELYGKFNIVWFPHSVTGPESGQRSNKPVRTGDDYAGIQMRQCGRVQAQILQDLGGSAIFMPGGEVYMSLQRGTIDAGEFSVPEVDWNMGFQEVTDYWVLPGWHQPGPVSGVMINKDKFDSLSDQTKFMFKEAAKATMMYAWTYFEYGSSEYTNKFIEAGVEVTRLDDETINKIQELGWKYIIEDAEANPDFAKIALSQVKFMKEMALWREIQAPFMYGRNPVGLDETYNKLVEIAKQHGVYDSLIQLEEEVKAKNREMKFWEPGTPYIDNPVPVN